MSCGGGSCTCGGGGASAGATAGASGGAAAGSGGSVASGGSQAGGKGGGSTGGSTGQAGSNSGGSGGAVQSTGCGMALPEGQVPTIPGSRTGYTEYTVMQTGATLGADEPTKAGERQFFANAQAVSGAVLQMFSHGVIAVSQGVRRAADGDSRIRL